MDLDPFAPVGITAPTMRFLDVFLLHCLLERQPARHAARDRRDRRATSSRVAARGREPGLQLERGGAAGGAGRMGRAAARRMRADRRALDAAHGGSAYRDALAAAEGALADLRSRPRRASSPPWKSATPTPTPPSPSAQSRAHRARVRRACRYSDRRRATLRAPWRRNSSSSSSAWKRRDKRRIAKPTLDPALVVDTGSEPGKNLRRSRRWPRPGWITSTSTAFPAPPPTPS